MTALQSWVLLLSLFALIAWAVWDRRRQRQQELWRQQQEARLMEAVVRARSNQQWATAEIEWDGFPR